MLQHYNVYARVMDAEHARGQWSMLILTRRTAETLVIGKGVTVTVLDIRGNRVRIGVNAPRDVIVHREENFAKARRGQRMPHVRP